MFQTHVTFERFFKFSDGIFTFGMDKVSPNIHENRDNIVQFQSVGLLFSIFHGVKP